MQLQLAVLLVLPKPRIICQPFNLTTTEDIVYMMINLNNHPVRTILCCTSHRPHRTANLKRRTNSDFVKIPIPSSMMMIHHPNDPMKTSYSSIHLPSRDFKGVHMILQHPHLRPRSIRLRRYPPQLCTTLSSCVISRLHVCTLRV